MIGPLVDISFVVGLGVKLVNINQLGQNASFKSLFPIQSPSSGHAVISIPNLYEEKTGRWEASQGRGFPLFSLWAKFSA
jgi:hypothetical protein